jgi:quercetin dioxygenase-like cupin family protein
MAGRIIEPQGVYADDRGRIVTLPQFAVVGSTVIESRAGAVRGNHYHRNESHLMYVASGRMLYLEQDPAGELVVVEVGPGESVVTPPGAPHCTVFPEDTVFIALSDADRTGDRYEEHVVRIRPLHERAEVAARVAALGRLVTAPAPAVAREPTGPRVAGGAQ